MPSIGAEAPGQSCLPRTRGFTVVLPGSNNGLSVFPVSGGSPRLGQHLGDFRSTCLSRSVCLPRTRGFTNNIDGKANRATECLHGRAVGTAMTAIAKTDRETGATRSLVGHSLDVAHCVHEMLSRGVARRRLSMACGIPLNNVHTSSARTRSSGRSARHGKVNKRISRSYQWGRGRGTGHVAEAVAVIKASGTIADGCP